MPHLSQLFQTEMWQNRFSPIDWGLRPSAEAQYARARSLYTVQTCSSIIGQNPIVSTGTTLYLTWHAQVPAFMRNLTFVCG
jgi:hypothetical protein